jgi:hypothetical protein
VYLSQQISQGPLPQDQLQLRRLRRDLEALKADKARAEDRAARDRSEAEDLVRRVRDQAEASGREADKTLRELER